MDWLDLLAVQGTEHHSSKASILWGSAFFTVQLSHPYMTRGKTIALTRWTFVGKVMSLLFNMLSRLVITKWQPTPVFLPGESHGRRSLVGYSPRVKKSWSFSFSISPSNEHPGLICFRNGWLALLAVQGTLKSLLQHHSSKTSILWHSAFFTVQLSHRYITTGRTIALTRWDLSRQSNISAFEYAI